jgi:hypothetical protein
MKRVQSAAVTLMSGVLVVAYSSAPSTPTSDEAPRLEEPGVEPQTTCTGHFFKETTYSNSSQSSSTVPGQNPPNCMDLCHKLGPLYQHECKYEPPANGQTFGTWDCMCMRCY